MKRRFDEPRKTGHEKTPKYREVDNEMKKISYWIDHTDNEEKRMELVKKFKNLKREIHAIPCHPQTHKKFTFVRYADDWLVGVCGTKEECIALKAEIADFLSKELKLTLLSVWKDAYRCREYCDC